MTKAEELCDSVDVCLISGVPGERHDIARNFPSALLSRISARFAKEFEASNWNPNQETGHREWRIRNPSGLLSIKGMKVAFVWLCNRYAEPIQGETRMNRITINLGGENWGITGVAAVRQALTYLDLRGPLMDQNHLTKYIQAFLNARWNFVWDDIVLVWLSLEEKSMLRQLLVEEAFTYINNPKFKRHVPSQHQLFLDAIDGYFARADDLKAAYEELYQRGTKPQSPLDYSGQVKHDATTPPPLVSYVADRRFSRQETQNGGPWSCDECEILREPVRRGTKRKRSCGRRAQRQLDAISHVPQYEGTLLRIHSPRTPSVRSTLEYRQKTVNLCPPKARASGHQELSSPDGSTARKKAHTREQMLQSLSNPPRASNANATPLGSRREGRPIPPPLVGLQSLHWPFTRQIDG